MILIGQYDSPFTRRVAITLALYGMAFEHRPWSITRDADKIAPLNPLVRVPTLVLDDGEVLTETTTIITHLDETVGPTRALLPPQGADRRRVRAIAALAGGISDKDVSLAFELMLHKEPSPFYVQRCTGQIERGLAHLEADRAGRATRWWFGETMSHADLATACMLGHLVAVHPRLFEVPRYPALAAVSRQCEALAVFASHYQPFDAPV